MLLLNSEVDVKAGWDLIGVKTVMLFIRAVAEERPRDGKIQRGLKTARGHVRVHAWKEQWEEKVGQIASGSSGEWLELVPVGSGEQNAVSLGAHT